MADTVTELEEIYDNVFACKSRIDKEIFNIRRVLDLEDIDTEFPREV